MLEKVPDMPPKCPNCVCLAPPLPRGRTALLECMRVGKDAQAAVGPYAALNASN